MRGTSVHFHRFCSGPLIVSHKPNPQFTCQCKSGNFSGTQPPNRWQICDGLEIGKAHLLGRKALIALESLAEFPLQI